MVNFCAGCGCCTRTDIVREHLEDTLRICDVNAMGLYFVRMIRTNRFGLLRIKAHQEGTVFQVFQWSDMSSNDFRAIVCFRIIKSLSATDLIQ